MSVTVLLAIVAFRSVSAAPLANTVAVTIGGANAPVSYAGMVGPGLYQINVQVPSLVAGAYPVIAIVNGVSSQSGVMLRVAG